MTKNTSPQESEEQIQFVEYCKIQGIKVVSTQNGMYLPRKKSDKGEKDFNIFAYINRQKKMGLQNGFPDLIVLKRNQPKTNECLFLEMKRQKGGVVSDEQKEWIQWLDENDYSVGVAEGYESAVRILDKYLKS